MILLYKQNIVQVKHEMNQEYKVTTCIGKIEG
jgi:hypothetical protein